MSNLYPVEQKVVNFNGTEIMAARASNGKIYAGIAWICNGLGLDTRRQREKIQQHMTLSQGVATLPLPSNKGTQEALVIELDFVPLWLATVNPGLVAKEIQGKLVEYQLKAKDVLAAAFIQNNVVPFDERQVRMQLLKSALEHEERLESVEQRLTEVTRKVEEQITLQHHEQYALQKAINRRVLDLANRAEFQQLGFDEQNYITPDLVKVKRKLYSQIHRSIKDCFAVASYRDIRRCDFEEAMKYVQAWRPRLAA